MTGLDGWTGKAFSESNPPSGISWLPGQYALCLGIGRAANLRHDGNPMIAK
jgi:hypothetical protein